MQFFATKLGPTAHIFSCFLLVLTLFLSHLPTLSTAAPNPIPAPLAAPVAGPPEIPADIEAAGPYDGSEPVEPTLDSGDDEELDGGIDQRNDTVSDIEARSSEYCFVGWNKKNFKGNWEGRCCYSGCCYFYNKLLNKQLLSAMTIKSSSGGIYLWTSARCTGYRRWIPYGGVRDLSRAPAFYSMSQY